MSIAQGRVFEINCSQKGPINIHPKVNRLENTGILIIKVSDGIIVRVICITLILLNITYINLLITTKFHEVITNA
jgi:hypothetical protein